MGPLAILAVTAVALILALVAAAALYGAFSRTQAITLASTGDPNQSRPARLRRRLNQLVRATAAGRRLDLRLAGASLSLGAADYLVLVTAAALIVGFVSQPLVGYVAAVVLMIGVGLIADRWLSHQQRRRADRFVAQLPELARVLGNAANAGLALRSGIDLVAREMEAPASEEFAEVARRLSLGTPLEDTLRDLAERVPSPELSVLVKTIVVQSRAGGALVSALSSISVTLEERRELNREIKTTVTGAVFVGWLVVVIALAAVVMMNLIAPGALDRLIQTLMGQIILAVSGGLFVLGHLLIRRITRIEV